MLGCIYTAASFMLEDATVGRVHEPKIFPASLGILLTVLGLMLVVQQVIKTRKELAEGREIKAVKFTVDEHVKKIAFTVFNGIVYALLFARAGYVVSTIIFIGAELLLFNGFKKFRLCLIVAVSFSLFIYILFSKVFGVYLPLTPFIWI